MKKRATFSGRVIAQANDALITSRKAGTTLGSSKVYKIIGFSGNIAPQEIRTAFRKASEKSRSMLESSERKTQIA